MRPGRRAGLLLIAITACGLARDTAPEATPPEALDFVEIVNRAEAFGIPGISVAVVTSGGAMWAGAAGFSNVAAHIPTTPEHAFHLASVTKLFTAAVVLRLVDEGGVTLDDPVLAWLPEPPVTLLPNIERITVGQLLDHTSGLYPTNNDPRYVDAMIGSRAGDHAAWSPEEFVALAASQEPRGEPGAETHYSDTNYILLGMIVERVTGEPFRDHVRRVVFEPLGLESAYFLSEIEPGRVLPSSTARGYVYLNDELAQLPWSERFPEVAERVIETTMASERIDAAAGIVATAKDVARFAEAIYAGDWLSPTSRYRLLGVVDGLETEPVGERRQAIVSARSTEAGAIVTSEGDGPGGQHTILAYHPSSDVIVVALTNSFGRGEAEFLVDEIVVPIVMWITAR